MPEADRLEKEIKMLKEILRHLIAWISESASSPISRDEAKQLLQLLDE